MLINAITTKLSGEVLGIELKNKLQKVIYPRHAGSEYYNGWYAEMLYDRDAYDIFDFVPEISDIYTDQPDQAARDPGAVLHVGTMAPRIGVILLEDSMTKQEKVLLVSRYDAKEVYAPFGTRITDEEWKEKLEKMMGYRHFSSEL